MSKYVALLTGGTGYIGSNLVKRLVDEGWQVHLLVRSTSSLNYIEDFLERIRLWQGNDSYDRINYILSQVKPHIIFHLASYFVAQHDNNDIIPLINSNLVFGTYILEAMVANGVKYLINTGTSWQHYNNETYNPVCLYAATKQAFEDILEYYLNTSEIKAISLKLFDTYGPNDRRKKLFYLLKNAIDNNITLFMSPGEQLIDMVYIDDVIDAYIIAARRLLDNLVSKSEEYMVSSGKTLKLREIVAKYEEIIGKKAHIIWGGKPYREREVMFPWNNGVYLPGWCPKIDLDQGIIMLKNSYKV